MMIQDGIDPPQQMVTSEQVDQLIDPLHVITLGCTCGVGGVYLRFRGNFIHSLVDPVAPAHLHSLR